MTTINCPLQESAQTLKNHAAIVSGNRVLSYADFHQAASKTTQFLKDFGIKENDRVGIVSTNSIEYLIVLVALWRIGAISCLLSIRHPGETIDEQLQNVSCQYVITSLSGILDNPNIKAYKLDISKIVHYKDGAQEDTETFTYDLDQNATIMYTSGSTGSPKPALHTFGNHWFSALGSNENISIRPKDRWFLSLPLYHVSGLSILFRVLAGHGTIVIPEPGDQLLETIEKYRITHISLVSTQLYRLLLEEKNVASLQKLKAILLGGSSIPEFLYEKAVEYKLPVYVTYGLTEMSSQVATSRIESLDDFGRVKVLNYRQISISESGEVLVKGETLFKGYIENKKLILPTNENRWFQTGDIGKIDEENRLTIYGRRDNMFISGGENIQPEEIEYHLCTIDSIAQAVVVPIDSGEFGLRPVAFIKEKNNQVIDIQAIQAALKTKLPNFKLPEEFYSWPTKIEETEIKVDRMRLRDLAQNQNPDLKTFN